jgi:general secretion pathway protein D
VLSAGVARGQVTILSRPLVIAANNEEAEVNVGTQRPFIQVQRTTDGGVLDQIVQYKDVGTSLRILPTISRDGDVMLRVTQEVNSATGETGIRDAPVISTRSIQTQLLVRDGETVVLGGLVDTQRDRASGGIPILSSIPLVGVLFGRRVRRSTDSELFVFLTPRVIYAEGDLENATGDVRGNSRYIRRATKGVNPYVLPRPAKGGGATVPEGVQEEAQEVQPDP